MLKAYFKAAWRNLIRNKVYSTLNILGLASGMAVALLIGLWVNDQVSYDRWLPGGERAYQVRYNIIGGAGPGDKGASGSGDKGTSGSGNKGASGSTHTQSDVCLPLGEALKKDVPEVAYVSPAFGPISNRLTVGDKNLYPKGMNAGADFLKIFQFPLLKGSRESALAADNNIVLTASTATALFGTTDVIGKTLRIDGSDPRIVTAVLKDLPRHSSFQFNYLTVFSYPPGSYVEAARTNWNHDFFLLYVGLRPNVTYAQAEPKLRMLVKKYAPATYATTHEEVTMQSIRDWYLYSEYHNGVASGGLIDYIKLFGLTGIFVLLIACINFMNLSTARSQRRAREVGVRKVVGSSRAGLIMQFLIESLVVTFFSFGLSLVLVQLTLPAFNALTKTHIELPYASAGFWMIMLSYVVITGLLAGSRPAFYLSSFRPVKVLKGAMAIGQSATLGRKALVVLQFTCSIALIISTIVVYQQIQYARSRNTGYDANRLLVTDAGYYHYSALKQELLQSGLVSSVTKSTDAVTAITHHNAIDDWPGRSPNEPFSPLLNAVADTDYFKTLGIQMVAGRNFEGNFAADSLNVIFNEAAIKRMGLKDPVGKSISWTIPNTPPHLRIIGVVRDALTNSPFKPAEPTMFVYQPDWTFTLTYRLAPTVNTQVAMGRLRTIFDKNDAKQPYTYRFVSDMFASQFELEMLIGKLAGIFAVLAIFISCLGLFGLAAYTAEQRTKEIGIRKVLGASVTQMLLLLSKDFLLLVGLSCLIASPLALYFLHRWLSGYYYRVSVGWGVFVFSVLGAIGITLLTVGFQSVKAALMNPVKSLRTE